MAVILNPLPPVIAVRKTITKLIFMSVIRVKTVNGNLLLCKPDFSIRILLQPSYTQNI